MVWCYFFCRISCSILLSKIYGFKDKIYTKEKKKALEIVWGAEWLEAHCLNWTKFLVCISCLNWEDKVSSLTQQLMWPLRSKENHCSLSICRCLVWIPSTSSTLMEKCFRSLSVAGSALGSCSGVWYGWFYPKKQKILCTGCGKLFAFFCLYFAV